MVAAVHFLLIEVYRAYGWPGGATVAGRVLRDEARDEEKRGANWLRRLRQTARALMTDEAPGAAVRVTAGAFAADARADDEGLFEVGVPGPLAAGELPLAVQSGDARWKGALRVAAPDCALTISDVDDTIVKTHVSDLRSILARTLLGSSDKMKAPGGAASFLRTLTRDGRCPLVLVSGSPLGLHGRLRAFLKKNAFPPAQVALRNWGLGDADPGEPERYKPPAIDAALALAAPARAVLLGDSGERDPEVYRAIAGRHGARIAAVYIRVVKKKHARGGRLDGMFAFRRYADALADARARGLAPAAP